MTRLIADVAVLGGGLIGSWTAYFLARRGKRVVLIEKGVVGAQSSGTNFGNLRLQGRFPGQYPLSLRAQDLWERLEDLIGDSCEFDATGHLYCAFDEAERDKIDHYAEVSESYGIRIEHLDRAQLKRRFPWLGRKVIAATYSARDATANPRLVTPAVARVAKSLGVTVVEHCAVREVRKSGDTFHVDTDTDLQVECGHVVNAAGAWALEFAERFGETAPLFPAGPPQFVTEPFPYFITPSVQTVDGSVIARQIPRGNVILAGYPRTAADPILNRAPVPPVKTLAAMECLAEVVPALRSCHVIRVWSGIEGYLPDMLPVIGQSETTPGLIHAFGFCGHGFQIGPGVGLCLSEIIVDGHTETPLSPFAIGRFQQEIEVSDKFKREFDAVRKTP
ncbi:NAD(P)/FAD-dependent oxidoreductase [Microvirga brassicacearum]|uniref:FAD-binding oxidoreductase n=1 Tax=Microvirga brassicacearum TaxID=2580413 RepID=A0A5N3P8G2_9HYPH|nr:FAD-binding oxidoreductase [Microvirga brassicacearum]KAB0265941.1 FAD-binding oxidoreductase [Microvirga brassicacearum]